MCYMELLFWNFIFSLKKITDRAKVEAVSLRSIKEQHNLDQETTQQWVCDVRQWALTGTLMSFHTSLNDCTFIHTTEGGYIWDGTLEWKKGH